MERLLGRRLLGRERRGTLVCRRRRGSVILSLLLDVVDGDRRGGELIGGILRDMPKMVNNSVGKSHLKYINAH